MSLYMRFVTRVSIVLMHMTVVHVALNMSESNQHIKVRYMDPTYEAATKQATTHTDMSIFLDT